MKHAALHIAVLAAIGDKTGQLALLSTAFATDFGHFARSNNRADIESAILATGKSPKGKAIALAISEGFKGAGLVSGYIGAKTGKYASQSPEVQQPFEDAIIRGCEAFDASLTTSEAFKDAAVKTAEEKAKAKTDKEEKAAKVKADILNSAVADGTMVRAKDVVAAQALSSVAVTDIVIDMLATGAFSDERAHTLVQAIAQYFPDVVTAVVTAMLEREALTLEAKANSDALELEAARLSADIERQVTDAIAVGADPETLGKTTARKTRGNKGRVHAITLADQQLTPA